VRFFAARYQSLASEIGQMRWLNTQVILNNARIFYPRYFNINLAGCG